MFQIDITLDEKVTTSILDPTGTERRIREGIQRLVREAAVELRDQAEQDAIRDKTGIQWPSLPNRSSAPGEVPAVQSGALIESIESTFSEDGMMVTSGPTVDYAVYLRSGLGGPDNARPIMEPALDLVGKSFTAKVIALIMASEA